MFVFSILHQNSRSFLTSFIQYLWIYIRPIVKESFRLTWPRNHQKSMHSSQTKNQLTDGMAWVAPFKRVQLRPQDVMIDCGRESPHKDEGDSSLWNPYICYAFFHTVLIATPTQLHSHIDKTQLLPWDQPPWWFTLMVLELVWWSWWWSDDLSDCLGEIGWLMAQKSDQAWSETRLSARNTWKDA